MWADDGDEDDAEDEDQKERIIAAPQITRKKHAEAQ